MTGIATAIVGSAVIGGVAANKGAKAAAGASRDAAELQAQGQREQLEYLKEVERLPQHYREGALSQLGSIYGLSAPQPASNDPAPSQPPSFARSGGLLGPGLEQIIRYQQSQQSPQPQQPQLPQQPQGPQGPQGKAGFVQGLMDDPFYQQLVGRGEDAVLRNASVTGGLRSGNVQDALARVNQDALFNVYNEQVSGLQGLAGLPSNANNIAGVMGDIGSTMAGGALSAGRAQQAGYQGVSDAIGTGIGQYIQYKGFPKTA